MKSPALWIAAAVAIGLTTTSSAPDQLYGGVTPHYRRAVRRNYDHAVRANRVNNNHYRRDRYRNYDQTRSDLYRYGTTNPYSSPGHLINDTARQINHYRRDQPRRPAHYRRPARVRDHGF